MADRWLQIARMNQEQIGELHLAYNRAFATVIDNAGNPIAADSHITPSMRTFLETLYLQAMKDDKMLNPKIQQIVAEHGCIPSDMRAIDRYMEATPQQRWSIKLSKRAQRTMTSMNKLCGEMHDEINMLLLISPHTFCQTNTDLSDSAIQRIMEHITCPNQYNRFSGGLGGWANTPPLSVVQAGDFRVDVMGYAHLERPRLKIKIHARNTNDGLEDKLDVEEMFAGGEFAGIVHYHVENLILWID